MQEFEEVYQQYFGQVYGFLFRMTGSTHIAEELTQETFLRALLNKATYREQGYMLTGFAPLLKTYGLTNAGSTGIRQSWTPSCRIPVPVRKQL